MDEKPELHLMPKMGTDADKMMAALDQAFLNLTGRVADPKDDRETREGLEEIARLNAEDDAREAAEAATRKGV